VDNLASFFELSQNLEIIKSLESAAVGLDSWLSLAEGKWRRLRNNTNFRVMCEMSPINVSEKLTQKIVELE